MYWYIIDQSRENAQVTFELRLCGWEKLTVVRSLLFSILISRYLGCFHCHHLNILPVLIYLRNDLCLILIIFQLLIVFANVSLRVLGIFFLCSSSFPISGFEQFYFPTLLSVSVGYSQIWLQLIRENLFQHFEDCPFLHGINSFNSEGHIHLLSRALGPMNWLLLRLWFLTWIKEQ